MLFRSGVEAVVVGRVGAVAEVDVGDADLAAADELGRAVVVAPREGGADQDLVDCLEVLCRELDGHDLCHLESFL